MKYIIELNEFDPLKKIDKIVDRIIRSGYISRSMEQELQDLSGVKNIVPQIYKKVNQLVAFYERANLDYIDDIMASILDDAPYAYKVKIGYYIPESCRRSSSWCLSSREYQYDHILEDEFSTLDKDKILTDILLYLKGANVSDIKASNISHEERKVKPWWVGNPRSRGQRTFNFFKSILDIQPFIRLELTHKDYSDYLNHDEYHRVLGMPGFSSQNFGADYEKTSLACQIKYNSRIRHLGNCVSVAPLYSSCYYTPHHLWLDGEDIINPNPVLVWGSLNIKFDLGK